jgi:membrane carboxypeptidase/penicillin-binding protein
MNSKKSGLGFHQLTLEEESIIISFDEYNEFYFPEYSKRRAGTNTNLILHSLIKRGLVVKDAPFKLTRSGIQVKLELLQKYAQS